MGDEIEKHHNRKDAKNSQQKSHPIEEMESADLTHPENKGEPIYQHDLHKKEGKYDQAQLQPVHHSFPKSGRLKKDGGPVLWRKKIKNDHQIISKHQAAVYIKQNVDAAGHP